MWIHKSTNFLNMKGKNGIYPFYSLYTFKTKLTWFFSPSVAFAWVKCEGEIEDCESFLRGKKILARAGKNFGVSSKFVRVSMLDREHNFDTLLQRISTSQSWKQRHDTYLCKQKREGVRIHVFIKDSTRFVHNPS